MFKQSTAIECIEQAISSANMAIKDLRLAQNNQDIDVRLKSAKIDLTTALNAINTVLYPNVIEDQIVNDRYHRG